MLAAKAKPHKPSPSAPPQSPEAIALPVRPSENRGSNRPDREIPKAIPVPPPQIKLTETGARVKNPANTHDPPNKENIKDIEQSSINIPLNPEHSEPDPVTTPTREITASIPLLNLQDEESFPHLIQTSTAKEVTPTLPSKAANASQVSPTTKENSNKEVTVTDQGEEDTKEEEDEKENPLEEQTATAPTEDPNEGVEEFPNGDTTESNSSLSIATKESSPLPRINTDPTTAEEETKEEEETNYKLLKTPPRMTSKEDNQEDDTTNYDLLKTPPRDTELATLSPEMSKLKTSTRNAKKIEKAKINEDLIKTPFNDPASDEAVKTPFKDPAHELDLEVEHDEPPLPEEVKNMAPVFQQAKQSGISKLQIPAVRKGRQAKKM
jgi:hypothetical protein